MIASTSRAIFFKQFSIRKFSSTRFTSAMTPGSQIPGLDFMKNVDPPVVKERSDYPDWVNELETSMASLAKLRKKNFVGCNLEEQKRYLKLSRRRAIKESNSDAGLR